MLRGVFSDKLPLIQVVVGWGHSVQTPLFILDTGFTGDLQVTPKIAQELNLSPIGVTRVRIANGQTIETPIALALASMEGSTDRIEVIIAQSVPLAGIGLLEKFSYKACVDCKYKTITLERVL